MRESNIKTCFHIIGAALCILAVFLLLPCFFSSPQDSDATLLILLTISLGLGATAIYMFAGAPHLTRFLRRRFPSEGHRTRKTGPPRHGLKACLGLGLGTTPLVAFLASMLLWPSAEWPEWAQGSLMVSMVLSPVLLTWSAAHIAWLRGVSPNAPLTVAITGLIVFIVLSLIGLVVFNLIGVFLMTVGPVITAFSLRSNRGYPVGRWRRFRQG